VAGSVAQRPGRGGHTWVFLQYLLGFRRLGFDVVFIDRLEPEMCIDDKGEAVPVADSVNLRYLAEVMDAFDLGEQWALLHDEGRDVFGMSRSQVRETLRRSDLLLNVMGFLDDDDLLAAAPFRVFLDIDPGFGQMWCRLGLHDPFSGHHAHVTIGEAIGQGGCKIPTCGYEWTTTKQPIVLEHWPVASGPGRSFTSIGAWRGPFAPIELDGETYGLRVHEFRRFFSLPHLVDKELEVALDIDQVEIDDLRGLDGGGWTLVDPAEVARDPWAYREYVASSRGELMIAKNMYVAAHSGWFSDRSICYLASGRPVIAQDTSLTGRLPIGEGLLTFTSVDEAVEAFAVVEADYPRHADAARAIAEEQFSSDVVLPRLLRVLDLR
jgi:hypothetical protein